MIKSEIKFGGLAFYDQKGRLTEIIEPSLEIKKEVERLLNNEQNDEVSDTTGDAH